MEQTQNKSKDINNNDPYIVIPLRIFLLVVIFSIIYSSYWPARQPIDSNITIQYAEVLVLSNLAVVTIILIYGYTIREFFRILIIYGLGHILFFNYLANVYGNSPLFVFLLLSTLHSSEEEQYKKIILSHNDKTKSFLYNKFIAFTIITMADILVIPAALLITIFIRTIIFETRDSFDIDMTVILIISIYIVNKIIGFIQYMVGHNWIRIITLVGMILFSLTSLYYSINGVTTIMEQHNNICRGSHISEYSYHYLKEINKNLERSFHNGYFNFQQNGYASIFKWDLSSLNLTQWYGVIPLCFYILICYILISPFRGNQTYVKHIYPISNLIGIIFTIIPLIINNLSTSDKINIIFISISFFILAYTEYTVNVPLINHHINDSTRKITVVLTYNKIFDKDKAIQLAQNDLKSGQIKIELAPICYRKFGDLNYQTNSFDVISDETSTLVKIILTK